MEVTKVAGADNGDELAAFDPESWLKVCTCGDKSSFCWSALASSYLLNLTSIFLLFVINERKNIFSKYIRVKNYSNYISLFGHLHKWIYVCMSIFFILYFIDFIVESYI